MKTIFFTIVVGFWLLFTFSCEKPEEVKLANRTVIVYMIADNNLDYFAEKDLNEMEEGWSDDFDGNLIVYVDRAAGAIPSHPVIFQIQHDTTPQIKSHIVSVFPEQNSCNKDVFSNTLSEIKEMYPALSYGLVLWSHGSGWLPAGYDLPQQKKSVEKNSELPVFKSFGRDMEDELNVTDLAQSIPFKFDFIIFDACFMGGVEVAYELKDYADYLLFSPTEILSYGYPYQDVTSLLFETEVNLQQVANVFFDFYNKLTDYQKSASVSLIRTAHLEELKQVCNTIIASTEKEDLKLENIQQLEIEKLNIFYDLDSYIQQITDVKNYKNYRDIMEKVVLYKRHTEYIYNQLELKDFSGLSIFIPNPKYETLNDFYQNLKWNAKTDI